jgi:hypothetical protein
MGLPWLVAITTVTMLRRDSSTSSGHPVSVAP